MPRRQPTDVMWKKLRDSEGTNVIEAALIMPLLLAVTFAIMDFGTIFYAYLALENGVSMATRYGVTGGTEAGLSREASIEKAMRDNTPTLTIADGAFTFSHLAPGSATWSAGPGDPNDIERVKVTYMWPLLTPVLRPFFPSGIVTLNVESAMKNEPRFN